MAASFGLSKHLFHGDRLSRAHLETIKAHGFDEVELFATRTHVDYHDARYLDTLQEALRATGVRAVSMHAPICESYVGGVWGRAYSNATGHTPQRLEAVDETKAALTAAKRLGCDVVVLHLGLPVTQDVPPGDNDRAAVRRSLEALAEASATAGVPLALEVLPNDLSDPDGPARLFRGTRTWRRGRLPGLRARESSRGRPGSRRNPLRSRRHDTRARQPRHAR